jgi:RNA polymerase sigma-70 factor (ECF subfamily)
MLKISSKGMTAGEFEEIYDLFWAKLYSLAYNYFRDKTTAQELVQDVFVNFWMKRENLGHVEDLSAYLFRSMKNRIYDHFDKIASQEKLVRQARQTFSEETHTTEEAVAYDETLELLNSEIDKLPDTTKTIFRLSRFDRYTNEEIASRLHVSGKAVEYHISQALKKLRLRLDHLIFFIIAMVLLGACA